MNPTYTDQIVGILLAAGRGRRFDPSGKQSKLLQSLPHGDTVLASAAKKLSAVLPVYAVCRSDKPALTAQLAKQVNGCTLLECDDADDGMAATLVYGLQQTAAAAGWVIALGDMPYVQVSTIMALKAALEQGADIAVPTCHGRRGNPVAFSRHHLSRLLQLRGDQGARSLLQNFPVVEVAVEDVGILQDVDTVADIPQS
jgi:molybdenum cofactor cytidylyltransferase